MVGLTNRKYGEEKQCPFKGLLFKVRVNGCTEKMLTESDSEDTVRRKNEEPEEHRKKREKIN